MEPEVAGDVEEKAPAEPSTAVAHVGDKRGGGPEEENGEGVVKRRKVTNGWDDPITPEEAKAAVEAVGESIT